MTDEETGRIKSLAIGRLFRMCARREQPGDIDDYERLRGLLLDLHGKAEEPYQHNWIRDRLKGAGGQLS